MQLPKFFSNENFPIYGNVQINQNRQIVHKLGNIIQNIQNRQNIHECNNKNRQVRS